MRKLLVSLFLLPFSFYLFAQETYTIDEHGTYVIDSGRIIKVPIRRWEDFSHFFHGFWGDIAIFQYDYSSKGLVIFNIKNGAVTEIQGTTSFVLPKFIEGNAYFYVLYGSRNDEYILKFDKVTLELIEKNYVDTLAEREYPHWKPINEEKIGKRTVRYTTDNGDYIDVIYDYEVEMREWWNFSVYYDSKLNRYVITVKFDDGK
jgi:hypothetical protein